MRIKFPDNFSNANNNIFIQLSNMNADIVFVENMKENQPKFDCKEEIDINVTKESDWTYYHLFSGIPFLPSACEDMVSMKIQIPKKYYKKIWIDSDREVSIQDTSYDDEVLINTGCIHLNHATLPNTQINYKKNNMNKQFLNIENSHVKSINVRIKKGGLLTIYKSNIDNMECLNDFDLKKEFAISHSKINHAEIQGYNLNVEDCTFEQIRFEKSDKAIISNSKINGYFQFVNSDVVLKHCQFFGNGCTDGSVLNFENYSDLYNIEDDFEIAYLSGKHEIKTILKKNNGKIRG